MRRGLTGTILWTLLALSVGVVLFVVKYEVKDLERRLADLNTEIHRNQESIHVLRAEWSFLNDPARLRAQAEKHLAMKPLTPAQVATLDTLPADGIPTVGGVYAAVGPARLSTPLPSTAKPADSAAKTRPGEAVKAPPPTRSAPSALAQVPTVRPPAAPAKTAAPAPAVAPTKGGRSIVIQSPALAQGEDGGVR